MQSNPKIYRSKRIKSKRIKPKNISKDPKKVKSIKIFHF